jgi:sugar phosphate isomerase/epimerase
MFKNLSTSAVGIKANFQQALDLAKRHGFAGIDAPVSEITALIDQRGAQAVNDMFAAAGLKPGGFGCPTNFRTDEGAWETGLAQLPRLAKAAQAIGCQRCYTWIAPASDTLDYAANFELHVTRLKPIAEILNAHGIRIGLEFVGPKTSRRGKKHEFIHDMEGAFELCDAIGTSNVGLLLDSWHWYASRGKVDDITSLKASEVVYVQVNDAPKGVTVEEQIDNVRDLPAATGVIDIKGFLQAIKSIGYDGPITAEPYRKDLATLPSDQAAKAVAEAMDKMLIIADL